jgi:hypothetical protein
LERQIPFEREVSVEKREVPQILWVPEVLETLCVANQYEISSSFSGVGVTGAEADARVIMIDGNAISLCSGGRRE